MRIKRNGDDEGDANPAASPRQHRQRGVRFRVLLNLVQRDVHVVDMLEPARRIFPQAPQNDLFEVERHAGHSVALGRLGSARRTAFSVSVVEPPGNARVPVTIS